MKKLQKTLSKVISILLSLLTLLTVLPMQTFATEYQNNQVLNNVEWDANEDLIIEEEVVSKRTSNSKTYLLEDGTYCELTNTNPIHANVNGEWIDSDITETPETIEEAISAISNNSQSFSSSANVDDGFILNAADKPISIWGVDEQDNVTTNNVTLNDSTIGILKCNFVNNDTIFKKTEITVKATLMLSCSNVIGESALCIRPITSTWDPETLSILQCGVDLLMQMIQQY